MTLSSSQPLVLVAEDEGAVRAMLGVVLRAAGFDSLLCADGRDALDRLEAGLVPDIVLLDIRMPRMDGVELTRAIRSEPKWDPIPLVAMSAYSDQLQQKQIIEAGADAFLPKPFTIADLREVLSGLSLRSPSVEPLIDRRETTAHAHHRDLRSQGEMMRAFRAAPLFELASLLGGMQEAPPPVPGESSHSWRIERLSRIIPVCIPLCEEYGLAASSVTLQRLERLLSATQTPSEAEVTRLVREALGRLTDELSLQSILFLDYAEAGLYTGRSGIDQRVLHAFPSVQDDLTEAAKCLALGRGTATVFHCMRVLQVILRAVAWDLGNPGIDAMEDGAWATVLARVELELGRPASERVVPRAHPAAFYPEVTQLLHSIAAAWRSPTLRPAPLYTEEHARQIWSETQALLRLLATEISEPGAPTASI